MRPERGILLKAIRDAGGNLSKTAGLLGCSRPTLYQWIYQHRLEREAGICLDRRLELDMRDRKDGQVEKASKPSVKPADTESSSLRLVPQTATVDLPINATVRIPESLWKRTRIEAIQRGCTVAELVQKALEVALAKDEQAPKRKGGDK